MTMAVDLGRKATKQTNKQINVLLGCLTCLPANTKGELEMRYFLEGPNKFSTQTFLIVLISIHGYPHLVFLFT